MRRQTEGSLPSREGSTRATRDRVDLAKRDATVRELMDDPECDPTRLRRTLERFAIVNRLVAAWGIVYRTHIRAALRAAGGRARILDIGCGAGDVLRFLLARARADGFSAKGVGIDPDQRSLEVALARPRSPGLEFMQARSAELVAAGERFDIVISNHLLHHLTPAEVTALLTDSQLLAERVALHSDIARGRIAYAAFAVAVAPLATGTFLRTDGLRSIRRSWTPAELATLAPPGWRVERPAPFRLLAVHEGG